MESNPTILNTPPSQFDCIITRTRKFDPKNLKPDSTKRGLMEQISQLEEETFHIAHFSDEENIESKSYKDVKEKCLSLIHEKILDYFETVNIIEIDELAIYLRDFPEETIRNLAILAGVKIKIVNVQDRPRSNKFPYDVGDSENDD